MTIDYRARAERLADTEFRDREAFIVAAERLVADATAEATGRIAALENEQDGLRRQIDTQASHVAGCVARMTAAEARADKLNRECEKLAARVAVVTAERETLATENKRLTEALDMALMWMEQDIGDPLVEQDGLRDVLSKARAALAAPRPPDLIAGAPRTNVGALPDAAAQGTVGVVARSQEPPNAPTQSRAFRIVLLVLEELLKHPTVAAAWNDQLSEEDASRLMDGARDVVAAELKPPDPEHAPIHVLDTPTGSAEEKSQPGTPSDGARCGASFRCGQVYNVADPDDDLRSCARPAGHAGLHDTAAAPEGERPSSETKETK